MMTASTTGIAASLTGRRFLGIERGAEFVELSKKRREELENPFTRMEYRSKLSDLSYLPDIETSHQVCESAAPYGYELPFA